MGKKLLAGILGGVAFFFWSFLAHDVLPLGKTGIKEVPNEQAVLTAMKANMPDEGLYFLPGLGMPENATRAQQSAAMEARMHKVETGPSGFLVYHPSLKFSFGKALAVELGTNILQVLLAVILLGQTSLVSFVARWRFLTLAGILAAISTNISYWNWYGFPWDMALSASRTTIDVTNTATKTIAPHSDLFRNVSIWACSGKYANFDALKRLGCSMRKCFFCRLDRLALDVGDYFRRYRLN